MKTFILLTFGFLTFAFYQMSGGADFQPASVRMAAMQPVEKEIEVVEVAEAETVPAQEENEVTRVSLNLTSLTTEADTTEAPAENEDLRKALEMALAEEPLAEEQPQAEIVPTNVAVLSTQDTPAIIPSLIAPNDTGAAVRLDTNVTDLREVTASRVNVRGGPGTEYGVVSKLERGDAVEIIEDTGTGWVRMRPLAGGQEGWMADFLLTNG